MDFKKFKEAVATQFGKMSQHDLFTTKVTKDELWTTYLSSFPAGTNPIYRERTVHDCNCCKQFIRNAGSIVTLIDGKLVSIWDIQIDEPHYQAVANALSSLTKSYGIENFFLHTERTVGTDKNFEALLDGQKQWDHFFINLPTKVVKHGAQIGPTLGEWRAQHDVLARSLDTITLDAVDTVLELISQNSLYRGTEHKATLETFRKLKVSEDIDDNNLWAKISGLSPAVSKIRNTSIGTLLIAISEGTELEDAVKSFEAMVAPANYKRPTAIVSKKMIDAAKTKIEELGLTSALERRYATLADITINNVLFADRTVRKVIDKNVFDELSAGADRKPKKLDKVEEVSIEKFIKDILPGAESLEVMVENEHVNNLVSLIAPVDPTAAGLFKWPNNFSWSYNGEFADSDMRKSVRARGGKVDGAFRFTHQWNYEARNASLMDLHVFIPGSNIDTENVINDYYGNSARVGWNNRTHHPTGGSQDVDYTPEAPIGYVPVENITFPDLKRMPEGRYICKVHNWNLTQPTQGGFKAEIEFAGQIFQYEMTRPLKHKEWVTVAEVTLKNSIFTIKHHLPVGTASKKVWGVDTNNFHKVSSVMLSPNYWDERAVGNQHYFFMLENCLNEGKARGFFNEFLRPDLDAHRKVIEMVGAKMKTDESNDQLSGVGFSSTQRNSIMCRVTGAFTRIINITF